MKRKHYDRELRRLHGELVAVQQWVKESGAKICIVFEGRDTAGKGGTIKAITERVSPRVFRVIALPAPNAREKSQMYIQRYLQHFPAAGEIVIFDRSWYNRAGVERVMGFCTPEDSKRFLELAPSVEKAMVDSGILLIKYWLEVSRDEQTRRLQSRIDDPRKFWKLSELDLHSYSRWYDYSRARDDMFAATDTDWAPWWIVDSDDKKRARLNVIAHLLGMIPYKPLARPDVELPASQTSDGYQKPKAPRSHHPDSLLSLSAQRWPRHRPHAAARMPSVIRTAAVSHLARRHVNVVRGGLGERDKCGLDGWEEMGRINRPRQFVSFDLLAHRTPSSRRRPRRSPPR